MPQQIQLRRGTAAQWAAANPVLAEGELGLETDTRKTKIGNGVAAWAALAYAVGAVSSVNGDVGDVVLTAADVGAPAGSGTSTGTNTGDQDLSGLADLEVGINSQSANYTLVLADSGRCVYHPPADTTARTWTIPANASVPFPVGTAVTFDNDFGAGAITIAITSDTMVLVGSAGTTGSRTLATGGQATAIKVSATRWRIAGTGLT